MKFSLNMASLVILLAVIACGELSLVRRVEAEGETCSLTSECMRNNTCGTEYLVVCIGGICTCVHRTGAIGQPLKQEVEAITDLPCKKSSDCKPQCGKYDYMFCKKDGFCICLYPQTSYAPPAPSENPPLNFAN